MKRSNGNFLMTNSKKFRDNGMQFVTGINYPVKCLGGFFFACLADWLLGWLLVDTVHHNHFTLKTTNPFF
jgi:hypothetical protein